MNTLLSRGEAAQKLSPVIVSTVPPRTDPSVGDTDYTEIMYLKALAD